MKIAFVTYCYISNTDHLCDIFLYGLKKQQSSDEFTQIDWNGHNTREVIDTIKKSDIVMVTGTWGSSHVSRNNNTSIGLMNTGNQMVKYLCETFNKPLFIFESPTLSRVRSTVQTIKEAHPRYYRVSLNHWLYGLGKFFDEQIDHLRFESFCKLNKLSKPKSEPQWATRSKNSPILVLPEKNSAPTPHGINPIVWTNITINALKRYSKRPIWIKANPHHFEDTDYNNYALDQRTILFDKNTNLSQLIDQAWATVILDSTACFESLWRGVPVFCYPGSFASELGNVDLSQIDNPVKANLLPWWQKMAFTEYTQMEIQQGKMWEYVRPFIQKQLTSE